MSIRLDSSSITSEQQASLEEMLQSVQKPYLADGKGNQIELPASIYQVLVSLLNEMKQGNSIVMVPEQEEFTSQAAANFLGMSRQYLVSLVETGKIPFHKVGTHRRIKFKDILEFQKQRDLKRNDALNEYFNEIENLGLYE